jgi:8-oxo-(d)GTP phosphatase
VTEDALTPDVLAAQAPAPDGRETDGPVLAAGALLWRPGPGGPEVALVHRPKYDDWSLPKGKADKGETPPLTAVREVLEETGHPVALGRPLPNQRYQVTGADGLQREKLVRWWVAEVAPPTRDGTGVEQPTIRLAQETEIDAVEWLPVGEVPARASRPADVDLVAAWLSGPQRTRALIVLRHANAVARRSWDGPDVERPLTPRGLVQARALPRLLAAYGVSRLISSPAARCVQTLTPYAEGPAAQRQIELDAAFDEVEAEEAGPALLALLDAPTASSAPVPDLSGTVVCTHRPTLGPLLAALAERIDGPPPAGKLAKAGMHVLHVAGGRVVASETYEQGRDIAYVE